MPTVSDTHQRALAINIDTSIYGSFAEIGAGQEVARWFFHVGGAAGTVARTICAYDMAMSDAVYGKADRYVSRERLQSMLACEHALLLEQLGPVRGKESRFFAFADTVSARNYAGTNECHGWIGLRFQHVPGAEPSQVLLHVNLMEPSNLLQQQAIGILGVNLIHAAYHERDTAPEFLAALFGELTLEQLEVDVAEILGPAFDGFEPAALALQLVRQGLAHVVVLDKDGAVAPPSEVLRKRPLVIQRGASRRSQPVQGELLAAATKRLKLELGEVEREPLALYEVSIRPLDGGQAPDDREVLRSVAHLSALDFPVAVSSYERAWELSEFVRRYTQEPVRFALDTASLVELLTSGAGRGSAGVTLQALGKLFSEGVRLYVAPMPVAQFREQVQSAGLDPATIGHAAEGPVAADGVRLAPPIGHMHDYLLAAGWIVPLPSRSAREAAAR